MIDGQNKSVRLSPPPPVPPRKDAVCFVLRWNHATSGSTNHRQNEWLGDSFVPFFDTSVRSPRCRVPLSGENMVRWVCDARCCRCGLTNPYPPPSPVPRSFLPSFEAPTPRETWTGPCISQTDRTSRWIESLGIRSLASINLPPLSLSRSNTEWSPWGLLPPSQAGRNPAAMVWRACY